MKNPSPDQIIDPKELLDRLSQIKGSKIITVVMHTEVKLLKKSRDTREPCPFKTVTKRTRCKVMVGTDFQNGVNNYQEKQGGERDFEAQPHLYADTNHEEQPVIAKHRFKDQYYMNGRLTETYETELYADGKLIDKDALKEYMPAKKPKPQGDPRGQWRNIKVFPECSIEQINTDGKVIEVQS